MLSPDEVQHILDVVINQDDFFGSTQQFYGRIVPDVGSTLLIVHTSNQSQTVRLTAAISQNPDQQTQNVFAIRDFLINYHPAQEQSYVPPGIAVLAIMDTTLPAQHPWLYQDISLALVSAQECRLLPHQGNGKVCLLPGGKTGLFPMYGKRSQELLQPGQAFLFTRFHQDGHVYQVTVWPLLPDTLYPQPDGSHSTLVATDQVERWPLLPGRGSGTPPNN